MHFSFLTHTPIHTESYLYSDTGAQSNANKLTCKFSVDSFNAMHFSTIWLFAIGNDDAFSLSLSQSCVFALTDWRFWIPGNGSMRWEKQKNRSRMSIYVSQHRTAAHSSPTQLTANKMFILDSIKFAISSNSPQAKGISSMHWADKSELISNQSIQLCTVHKDFWLDYGNDQ